MFITLTRRHHALESAVPNEFVNTTIHCGPVFRRWKISSLKVRGANGFVCLLCLDIALCALFRNNLVNNIRIAEFLSQKFLRRDYSLLRENRVIGSHVGDMTRLVQTLGDHHSLLRITAEASG